MSRRLLDLVVRCWLMPLVAVLGFATATSAAPPSADGPHTIWIEGEDADQARVKRHPWWYDKVKQPQLSGGQWVSNFGPDAGAGELLYRFEVEHPASYRLFIRLNPVRSGYRYQLGGGAWQQIDLGAAFDQRNIAADDKPDLRFIGWVDLGEAALEAGEQTLRIRIDGEVDHHGAVDAIALTTDRDWMPQGTQKPGEAGPVALGEAGSWTFEPKRDRFTDDALLDLSHLNEDVAGQHGFIRVDDHGDFVNDAGPIRFWAVGNTVYRKGREALQENARFLAKRGVNMVRWHGNLAPTDPNQPLDAPNQQALDELFQYVAAMKDAGIYLTVSPYYAHSTKTAGDQSWRRERWGLPRDPSAENTGSLLFFDPTLQSAYKHWVRAMMTRPNPYTGVALKDEPAIAIFQIQNEDSLLFWTINNVQGEDREILRRQFGDWLKEKYGSLGKARAVWNDQEAQGAQQPTDWDAGSIAISNAWAWFQPNLNRGDLSRRMSDEVQFLTQTMRDWNAEVERFLREEIGAKQIINAGNWRTADPLRLDDLERYSYTGQEVIGKNRYTTALHEGPHRGWAIAKGDRFTNRSITLHPDDLPVGLKQTPGKAMIIPEGNWVPPNLYQSEGPFLVAAYMGLNGVDALYWFNMGEIQWRQPSSANGYLPSVGKWVIETPEIMGNFPAAALMHRRGYIARGEPVVVEHRRLTDLWERKAPIISEAGTFDPNRDQADLRDQPVSAAVDQKAFVVGPVQVVYDSDPGRTRVVDLSRYIDTREQVVRSVTGQHRWDYGQGLVYVDAPKAQGVTGFLSRRDQHDLADVSITSANAYATIVVVAMDDQPIASSGQLLVQIGTTARPTGWTQREVQIRNDGQPQPGFELIEHGRPPWRVENLDASLTLANPGLTEAVVLDPNGYPRQTIPLQASQGRVSLTLPTNAKYVLLR